LKIDKTVVKQTAEGFEQELSYQCGHKIRRELFLGRSRDELAAMIIERRRELERL